MLPFCSRVVVCMGGVLHGSRLNAENRVTRRYLATPSIQGLQGYTPVPVTYCSCLQSTMKNVSTLSILYSIIRHLYLVHLSVWYILLSTTSRTDQREPEHINRAVLVHPPIISLSRTCRWIDN